MVQELADARGLINVMQAAGVKLQDDKAALVAHMSVLLKEKFTAVEQRDRLHIAKN